MTMGREIKNRFYLFSSLFPVGKNVLRPLWNPGIFCCLRRLSVQINVQLEIPV